MRGTREQQRSYYRQKLRSDNPRRSSSGPPVYAEMFIEPIKRVGKLPLVQMTGLSYRTFSRIVSRQSPTIAEDTAERLCIALGLEFHDLPYVLEAQDAALMEVAS